MLRAAVATLLVFLCGIAWAFPVAVTDDRGREIVIERVPERVVVLLPFYAEILLDLGAGDRIVGVADSPNNPPEVADLPSVGPSFSPSVEAIVALEPDLVLGAWGDVRDRLESLGIVVLTAGGPGGYIRGIADIFDAIRKVGVAVGLVDRATGLVGKIAEEIVRIEAAVLGLPQVRVAFLYMTAPDSPPWAAGRGTPENELILRAGGANVFGDLAGFPQVSLEELVLRDPEVILTDPAQVANVAQSQRLREVSAVRAGRIYGIEASALISTRVAAALRRLVELLHPDALGGEGGT
ncbi:ABC transporter substrate-binding protein [Candidatus Bipolaricaulota sp. J31]